MKEKIKKGVIDSFLILVLFLGIMASLDEFYHIRERFNHYFIGLALTLLVVFIWKNIIKKLLSKWF
ncbi:MAG: hypothetical protein AAB536_02235 [Patescibacteria group bacterium]